MEVSYDRMPNGEYAIYAGGEEYPTGLRDEKDAIDDTLGCAYDYNGFVPAWVLKRAKELGLDTSHFNENGKPRS